MAVYLGVAIATECNEVFFSVAARVAAEFLVVNFEVRHCTADLASPAITAQNLQSKVCIRLEGEPQRSGFERMLPHDAFAVK